ncbi:MAG TPA: hypothetical protein VHC94_12985 [Nitrobacter sp.]|jgi:hypothetical protein|nr:hypothetical protein [Nitrobacter sp.]
MTGVVQDWRIDLAEARPEFFAPRPDRPCVPECGPGWRGVIERCCIRIDAALQDGERFRFERMREVQGSLRISWGGRLSAATEAAVREAVDLTEARSQCVCELCGKDGRAYRCEGNVATRCTEHRRGTPVAVRAGFENLHLRQKLIARRARVVVASLYDPDRDRFVDLGCEPEAAR